MVFTYMTDALEPSSNIQSEATRQEYDPMDDPLMHRVIVKAAGPLPNIWLGGYKTELTGAKVNLHDLAAHNQPGKGKRERQYDTVYFTTQSGTIYRVQDLHNGAWQLEGTSNARQYMIQEACSIEVGRGFQSPHMIGNQPEIYTSPIQDITLVNTRAAKGYDPDIEQTDIATRFTHVNPSEKIV